MAGPFCASFGAFGTGSPIYVTGMIASTSETTYLNEIAISIGQNTAGNYGLGYYVQLGSATSSTGTGFVPYALVYAAGVGGETQTFTFSPPIVIGAGLYIVALTNFPTTAVMGGTVSGFTM